MDAGIDQCRFVHLCHDRRDLATCGRGWPPRVAGVAPKAGTQFTISVETPSLNSFIRDDMTDADCVAADA